MYITQNHGGTVLDESQDRSIYKAQAFLHETPLYMLLFLKLTTPGWTIKSKRIN